MPVVRAEPSGTTEAREHRASSILQIFGLGAHRWPAVASGATEHLHHRLRRDRIRVAVSTLELPRRDQHRVELTSALYVAGNERVDHLADLRGRPMRRNTHYSNR